MTTVTIEETAPTGALVLAGDPFTEPELQALGARGAVRPLLPGVWARPDAADDPAVRAAALWTLGGPLLAAGWTAIGPSAAWILAGGAAPGRLHAAVPHFHRRPAGGGLLPWTLTDLARRGPAFWAAFHSSNSSVMRWDAVFQGIRSAGVWAKVSASATMASRVASCSAWAACRASCSAAR